MTRTSAQQSTVDLHTHSTASDGTSSPADLVALAKRRGIATLALTDHDSTTGLAEAIEAGIRHDVTIVPGVELGAHVDAGELHLLGYFIDQTNADFQRTLSGLREGRQRRAERMVEQLNAVGVAVDLAAVRRLAGDGAIGRAHIARVLVESGQAGSVNDAFDRYLSRGRPGYVERPRLLPADAVRLVLRAGGVPVLAHPFTVADLETTLDDLAAAGLAGLEVYYSAYSADQQAELRQLADRRRLLATGGSDFHGLGEREGAELGSAPVPPDTVDRLRRLAGRHSR